MQTDADFRKLNTWGYYGYCSQIWGLYSIIMLKATEDNKNVTTQSSVVVRLLGNDNFEITEKPKAEVACLFCMRIFQPQHNVVHLQYVNAF